MNADRNGFARLKYKLNPIPIIDTPSRRPASINIRVKSMGAISGCLAVTSKNLLPSIAKDKAVPIAAMDTIVDTPKIVVV